jgi:hypothetical protein
LFNTFSGSYFDGSIDFKGSLKHMMDGVQVDFGADWIHTNRNLTRAFLARILAAGERMYGATMFAGVKITDSCGGEHAYFDTNDYEAGRLLNGIAYKRSMCLNPRKSATADKVIFLGNDGYSQVGSLCIQ